MLFRSKAQKIIKIQPLCLNEAPRLRNIIPKATFDNLQSFFRNTNPIKIKAVKGTSFQRVVAKLPPVGKKITRAEINFEKL